MGAYFIAYKKGATMSCATVKYAKIYDTLLIVVCRRTLWIGIAMKVLMPDIIKQCLTARGRRV
jgi:hypothetical protein